MSVHRVVDRSAPFAHLLGMLPPAPPLSKAAHVQLSPPAPATAATAEQAAEMILASGKRRRAETMADMPPPGSIAEQILQAGRRRRGEL